MVEARAIVGLGNPGPKYTKTRHNLGFLVLARLAERNGLKITESKESKALCAFGSVAGQECHLLWPLTFMNLSGRAVKPFADKQQIPLENILVVCDDLNLDFGVMRIRRDGGDGGHNGLASILESLTSDKFPRLRIGIGAPRRKDDTVDFVLEEFSKSEWKSLEAIVDKACECCEAWLTQDIEQVMNQFNKG